MVLSQQEKNIAKRQKYEVIRYYRNKVKKLEKRIEYLEGKEFYEGIKEDIIKELTKNTRGK